MERKFLDKALYFGNHSKKYDPQKLNTLKF